MWLAFMAHIIVLLNNTSLGLLTSSFMKKIVTVQGELPDGFPLSDGDLPSVYLCPFLDSIV